MTIRLPKTLEKIIDMRSLRTSPSARSTRRSIAKSHRKRNIIRQTVPEVWRLPSLICIFFRGTVEINRPLASLPNRASRKDSSHILFKDSDSDCRQLPSTAKSNLRNSHKLSSAAAVTKRNTFGQDLSHVRRSLTLFTSWKHVVTVIASLECS